MEPVGLSEDLKQSLDQAREKYRRSQIKDGTIAKTVHISYDQFFRVLLNHWEQKRK